MTITAEQVSIPVGDNTTMHGHLRRPATGNNRTAVIVLHELFGVTPALQEVVGDLAAAGFVAVAPELYHRGAPPGQCLGRDDAGRAQGFALLHQLTRQSVLLDLSATIELLQSDYGAQRIALVGFSAGGHIAYLGATQLPISTTVILYGGWLTTTDIALSQPEPTLELTPGISGRMTYLVGEDDTLISDEQQGEIAAALTAAGVPHELVSYPHVGHAFFWPDSPTYDQTAHDDAWTRILRAVEQADQAP